MELLLPCSQSCRLIELDWTVEVCQEHTVQLQSYTFHRGSESVTGRVEKVLHDALSINDSASCGGWERSTFYGIVKDPEVDT